MPKLVASNVIENHPLFEHFVKVKFDFDEITTITGTGFNYLVLPYGNLKIIDSQGIHALDSMYLNSISNFYKLSAKKGDSFIVIRLKSDRFHKITDLNVSTVSNIYPLKNIIPKHICNNIYNESKHCDTYKKLSAILDKYLADYYPIWSEPSAISKIIEYIFSNNGMMNVSDILTHFSISHSNLNRKFKEIIGMTSNKFLRIVRFNYIMRHIETEKTDILSLIEDYKYYDYSHFTKDFKTFTGQTPKHFFGSKHPMLRDILYKKIIYYK